MFRRVLLSISVMLFYMTNIVVYSQEYKKSHLNYQGSILNDKGGSYANKELAVKISILRSKEDKQAIYWEIRNVKTNKFGIYQILIGSPGAENSSNNFEKISWHPDNVNFFKIEFSLEKNGIFNLAGYSPIAAVPYTMYAEQGGTSGYNTWKNEAANANKSIKEYLNEMKYGFNIDNFTIDSEKNKIKIQLNEFKSETPIITSNYLLQDFENRIEMLVNGISSNKVFLGNSILHGKQSPPYNNVGVNGDFYFDTESNKIYGPKTNGEWGDPIEFTSKSSIPAGGKSGQVLAKKSDNDFDVEWINTDQIGIPNLEGNEGKVLSNNGTKAIWIDPPRGAELQLLAGIDKEQKFEVHNNTKNIIFGKIDYSSLSEQFDGEYFNADIGVYEIEVGLVTPDKIPPYIELYIDNEFYGGGTAIVSKFLNNESSCGRGNAYFTVHISKPNSKLSLRINNTGTTPLRLEPNRINHIAINKLQS